MAANLRSLKIVLIGAGNVAHHIGKALDAVAGYPIAQVYNRSESNAKKLASKLHCLYTTSPEEIVKNADVYLICVHDDQIIPVTNTLAKVLPSSSLVVHTSGSIPADIIKPFFKKYGVLYPLQTFSLNKKIVFAQIPIFLVASDKFSRDTLHQVASSIAEKIHVIKDAQKEIIHLAAVLANNFSNAFFDMSSQILKKHKLPFEILVPLIQETVDKIKTMTPAEAQTGPAKRNDVSVLDRHKKILKKDFPEWIKVYDEVSSIILKRHNKK